MNLEECTLVELRQLAKERGIKYVSKLKKDELIEMLSQEKSSVEAERKETESLQSQYPQKNRDCPVGAAGGELPICRL